MKFIPSLPSFLSSRSVPAAALAALAVLSLLGAAREAAAEPSPLDPEKSRWTEVRKDDLREAIAPADLQVVVLMPVADCTGASTSNRIVVRKWHCAGMMRMGAEPALSGVNYVIVPEDLASPSVAETVRRLPELGVSAGPRYVLLIDWQIALRDAGGRYFHMSLAAESVLYDRRDQRWQDAADAYRNIVRLSPPDAANISDYGEALVMANQGMVPAPAHALFDEALKLDPKFPKARFYDALGLKQEGKTDEAKAAFEAFLKDTPEDAPWRPMLLAEMQDMNAKPPALDQQTMADAAQMSGADQQAMIRSMVDGLEQKLAANPDNLDGWLRLIRARVVLGDTDKAQAAYKKALETYSGNEDALAQIAALGRDMKLE